MSSQLRLIYVEGHLEEPAARKLLRAVGISPDYIPCTIAGGCKAFWQRAANFNTVAQNVGFVFGLQHFSMKCGRCRMQKGDVVPEAVVVTLRSFGRPQSPEGR